MQNTIIDDHIFERQFESNIAFFDIVQLNRIACRFRKTITRRWIIETFKRHSQLVALRIGPIIDARSATFLIQNRGHPQLQCTAEIIQFLPWNDFKFLVNGNNGFFVTQVFTTTC